MIVLLFIVVLILLFGILIARFVFPRRKLVVMTISVLLAGYTMAAPFIHFQAPYSEKRPNNFILSKDTPISMGHGILGNLSTSTEPIDILSYGVKFRIPRNYIDTILYNKRDKEVLIELGTLYPDFSGVRQKDIIPDKFGVLRWRDQSNIVKIVTTYSPFSPEHDPNTVVFTAEANEPNQPWQYALLKSTERSKWLSDVYFQRPEKNNKGFVVSCIKAEHDPQEPCSVYMRVSDNLVVEYQYRRELLPQWQEINEKVNRLIQSFILK